MLRVSPLPVGSETFFVENAALQSSFRPPSRHVSPRVPASIDASVSRGSTPSLPPSPATAGSNPAEVREIFTVEASRSTGYGYDRGVQYRDALRQQRKTWGGPVNEEFWFYVCNTHEILSIFMQHPKHPIAMWQRVVMLLVSSTLSLAWSAIALDAQLSLGQQYSNGVVAVLLSLGAILEILFYKVIFSATNFIAWLFCTDKPVSQSPLAGIVKDLFSGVGPLYILAMIGWAAFLTSIALLSALRVGGVAMSDILTVLMLERVHTWSWQFMCVAAITFIAGRRREAFERLAARKAAAMVIAPPDDVNPSTDADTSVDEESAQLVKGSGQQRVSGALALAAKGFDDSLNWEELQWWCTHDFVPPQPQQSLSVRLRAWVQDVLRVHQQQPSASPV